MSFRIFALAGATAVLLAVPLSTNLSAQPSVEIGPGGVRVHDRYDSRRRDEGEYRRHDRYDSRGRGRCRIVTVRERLPNGDVEITRRRECD